MNDGDCVVGDVEQWSCYNAFWVPSFTIVSKKWAISCDILKQILEENGFTWAIEWILEINLAVNLMGVIIKIIGIE